MAEYILTPAQKEVPEASYLLDEMHRRGFAVEINIKGTAKEWDAIRFSLAGPPEIECFLSREGNGSFDLSTAQDAPAEASELQLNLADLLLSRLGGQLDNTATRERFTPASFTAKLKSLHGPAHPKGEWAWIVFSWAIVAAGLLVLLFSSQGRGLAAAITALSLVSAGGLTYAHFKG